jgi:hypothetical protein
LGGTQPVRKEETKRGVSVKLGELDLHKKEIDNGIELQGLRAERKQTGGKLKEVTSSTIVGI